MSKLNSLFNLTSNKKPNKVNPIVMRRNKLIKGINKQLKNIDELKQGMRVRNTWWFNDENNNFYLSIRYGKSELELDKGKFSIMCKDIDEVSESLEKIKELVVSGSFDTTLNDVSKSIRTNFKSSKTKPVNLI